MLLLTMIVETLSLARTLNTTLHNIAIHSDSFCPRYLRTFQVTNDSIYFYRSREKDDRWKKFSG